jgi:hypothetical protein
MTTSFISSRDILNPPLACSKQYYQLMYIDQAFKILLPMDFKRTIIEIA